jgi:hypothetical protein
VFWTTAKVLQHIVADSPPMTTPRNEIARMSFAFNVLGGATQRLLRHHRRIVSAPSMGKNCSLGGQFVCEVLADRAMRLSGPHFIDE